MSVFVKCPYCNRKNSLRNKRCSNANCRADMDKIKRKKNRKYGITFKLPDGTQKSKMIGNCLKEAKACDGKIKAKKAENRILDILPETNATMNEVSDWYPNCKISAPNLTICDRRLCIRNPHFG